MRLGPGGKARPKVVSDGNYDEWGRGWRGTPPGLEWPSPVRGTSAALKIADGGGTNRDRNHGDRRCPGRVVNARVIRTRTVHGRPWPRRRTDGVVGSRTRRRRVTAVFAIRTTRRACARYHIVTTCDIPTTVTLVWRREIIAVSDDLRAERARHTHARTPPVVRGHRFHGKTGKKKKKKTEGFRFVSNHALGNDITSHS